MLTSRRHCRVHCRYRKDTFDDISSDETFCTETDRRRCAAAHRPWFFVVFLRLETCLIHTFFKCYFQLQGVLQFQRFLRHFNGTERRGRQPAVDHLGQVAVQVPETVHRIRSAHRPEPKPPGVPDHSGQTTLPHDTVHAPAHQRWLINSILFQTTRPKQPRAGRRSGRTDPNVRTSCFLRTICGDNVRHKTGEGGVR